MTLEEYKKQIFKTDGEGNGITIGQEWDTTPRKIRKYITNQLKKGKNPVFHDVINKIDFYE